MFRTNLNRLIDKLNELSFIVNKAKDVIETKLFRMDIPINYHEIDNLIARLLNKARNVKNKRYINEDDINNDNINLYLKKIDFCKRKILSFCNNPENSEDFNSFILTIFPLESTMFPDNTTNSDLVKTIP